MVDTINIEKLNEDLRNGVFEGFPLKDMYKSLRSRYGKHRNETYLHYFLKMSAFIKIIQNSYVAAIEFPVLLGFEEKPLYYLDIGIPTCSVGIEIWTSKTIFSSRKARVRDGELNRLGWKVIDVFPDDYDFETLPDKIECSRK